MPQPLGSNGGFRAQIAAFVFAICAGATASAQTGYVNFESPHVSPLAVSPDATRLFAVNTPDNRVEIFNITGGAPTAIGGVPVGLEPVSVRPRTNTEIWVVNLLSDSISIVDVTQMNVARTLSTGDEPCDVVFAGGRAFVTCSQLNIVQVFDLANLSAPPTQVNIAGED